MCEFAEDADGACCTETQVRYRLPNLHNNMNLSVGVGEPASCPSLIVTVTTGVPRLSWPVPLLLQATMRMLMKNRKKIALHFTIRLKRIFDLS